MTWQHISPDVTVKDFKISNAMDGTDDGTLWNDSKDGNVRS